MIKIGLCSPSPALVRMLLGHPDVDIAWIWDGGRTSGMVRDYPELIGETDINYTANPEFSKINMYIGQGGGQLYPHRYLAENPDMKAVIYDQWIPSVITKFDGAVLGVAEYNRKALVRGARVAFVPSPVVSLGALALMQLAKSLLLNSPISGSMLLPAPSDTPLVENPGSIVSKYEWDPLRDEILTQLQTSFRQDFSVYVMRSSASSFATATFSIDCPLRTSDVLNLYHDFFDDHRHVVITGGGVTSDMVEGTNKAVIGLNPFEGRLHVAVGFDNAIRSEAGAAVHLLNLLFGLDEMTGF